MLPLSRIDKLEDHRKSGRHMEYWVRWKNANDFLTWEKEEKIQAYYPELVDLYWRERNSDPPPTKVQVELAPAGPRRSERVQRRQQLLQQREAALHAGHTSHPGGGEGVTRGTDPPATQVVPVGTPPDGSLATDVPDTADHEARSPVDNRWMAVVAQRS